MSHVEEIPSDGGSEDDFPKSSTNRKRKRKVTAKSRSEDLTSEQFLASMKDKKVSVKCNQTNKKFKVDVLVLSCDDGEPLTESDLQEGSQLLMDYNKKSWPVTIIKESNEPPPTKRKPKKPIATPPASEVDGDIIQAKAVRTTSLQASLNSPLPIALRHFKSHPPYIKAVPVCPLFGSSMFDNVVETIEIEADGTQPSTSSSTPLHNGTPRRITHEQPTNKLLKDIHALVKDIHTIVKDLGANRAVNSDDTSYVFDGVNLMHIPAKDMSAYGRGLLDQLFSKEEQARSVIMPTIKSNKPPLSPRRVQLLFDCVEKRYKDHDHRALMTTLSQKCRDAARHTEQ